MALSADTVIVGKAISKEVANIVNINKYEIIFFISGLLSEILPPSAMSKDSYNCTFYIYT